MGRMTNGSVSREGQGLTRVPPVTLEKALARKKIRRLTTPTSPVRKESTEAVRSHSKGCWEPRPPRAHRRASRSRHVSTHFVHELRVNARPVISHDSEAELWGINRQNRHLRGPDTAHRDKTVHRRQEWHMMTRQGGSPDPAKKRRRQQEASFFRKKSISNTLVSATGATSTAPDAEAPKPARLKNHVACGTAEPSHLIALLRQLAGCLPAKILDAGGAAEPFRRDLASSSESRGISCGTQAQHVGQHLWVGMQLPHDLRCISRRTHLRVPRGGSTIQQHITIPASGSKSIATDPAREETEHEISWDTFIYSGP